MQDQALLSVLLNDLARFSPQETAEIIRIVAVSLPRHIFAAEQMQTLAALIAED